MHGPELVVVLTLLTLIGYAFFCIIHILNRVEKLEANNNPSIDQELDRLRKRMGL